MTNRLTNVEISMLAGCREAVEVAYAAVKDASKELHIASEKLIKAETEWQEEYLPGVYITGQFAGKNDDERTIKARQEFPTLWEKQELARFEKRQAEFQLDQAKNDLKWARDLLRIYEIEIGVGEE